MHVATTAISLMTTISLLMPLLWPYTGDGEATLGYRGCLNIDIMFKEGPQAKRVEEERDIEPKGTSSVQKLTASGKGTKRDVETVRALVVQFLSSCLLLGGWRWVFEAMF